MKPYQDPNNEWNSSAYHTGEKCITPDCFNPAGTAWSPLLCFECNVKRMDDIGISIREIMVRFEARRESEDRP